MGSRSLRRRGEVARPPQDEDPPPPILGSWRNLYLLVAANLVVMVALFAVFTWVFR